MTTRKTTTSNAPSAQIAAPSTCFVIGSPFHRLKLKIRQEASCTYASIWQFGKPNQTYEPTPEVRKSGCLRQEMQHGTLGLAQKKAPITTLTAGTKWDCIYFKI